MKPCIPPEFQALADEAQARKDAAIARLQALAVEQGAREEANPFIGRMADLIDADKKGVQLRRRAG